MNIIKGKQFKKGEIIQCLLCNVKVIKIGKPDKWNFIPMQVKNRTTDQTYELKFHAESEYKSLTFFNRD